MAEYNHQIVSHNNQQQPADYADLLEPGYRFCPTDLELIVYYLKPKIETGKRRPNCRYYEVNLYDYSPDELTAKPEYRSYENKWYFLTPREPKHANGNRPNRQTKNGGTWKATQRGEPVKDATKRVVGTRTGLAYLDEKKRKTPWLMHEFITTNLNIPAGSQNQNMDKKKLTNWALCKIYKKPEPNRDANNNIWDQEAEIVEQNHLLEDEPSPRRRRVSTNQENNQWNGPQLDQIQESNHHSGTDVQMMEPVQSMLMSNQETDFNNVQSLQLTSMDTSTNLITMQPMATFCGSDSIQPSVQDHTQDFAMEQVKQSTGSLTCQYHPQSWPSPTQGFNSSDASSSSSMALPQEEDATGHVTQLDDFMTLPAQASTVQLDTNMDPVITMPQGDSLHPSRDEVLQQDIQNSNNDIPSFSFESSMMPDDEFDNLMKSVMAYESEVLHNSRDEVLQEHVQNSYPYIPSFSYESTMIPDDEFDNLTRSMMAHESEVLQEHESEVVQNSRDEVLQEHLQNS